MDPPRKRVLFLCTGNSCRSQMAEGLLRHLAGDRFESFSAGADPAGFVHPLAVRAMQELGIDISLHRSKSVDEFLPPAGRAPDLVVSVCESAAARCPRFPGPIEHLQIPIDDPAHAEGTEEEQLPVFRRVRDEIERVIRDRLLTC